MYKGNLILNERVNNEYHFRINLAENEEIDIRKRFSDFVALDTELCEDLDLYGHLIPKRPQKNKKMY